MVSFVVLVLVLNMQAYYRYQYAKNQSENKSNKIWPANPSIDRLSGRLGKECTNSCRGCEAATIATVLYLLRHTRGLDFFSDYNGFGGVCITI